MPAPNRWTNGNPNEGLSQKVLETRGDGGANGGYRSPEHRGRRGSGGGEGGVERGSGGGRGRRGSREGGVERGSGEGRSRRGSGEGGVERGSGGIRGVSWEDSPPDGGAADPSMEDIMAGPPNPKSYTLNPNPETLSTKP